MGIVLLDTSVASLLHPKKKGSELREKYEKHMRDQTLALSFQSVAELWQWAEANGWGPNARQALDAFVRRFLVIPYDYELARVWRLSRKVNVCYRVCPQPPFNPQKKTAKKVNFFQKK